MIDSKKYLLKIRTSDLQVVADADNLQAAKDALFKITPTLKDVSSFSGDMKSKTDEMRLKMEVYIERLNHSIDRFVDIRDEATGWLNMLIGNQRYYKVLLKRYFEYDHKTYKYKTLEEIAEEMGTSKQNIDKLHGRALVELDRIMKGVDKS